MLDFLRNPISYFADLERKQGPVARMKFGNRRFFLIHDPELIQDFLVTQSGRFEKFPQVSPDHGLFGRGLLTSEEPFHLRQRRLMQPAFHRDRLEGYAAQMAASTGRLMGEWKGGEVVDAAGAMNRLALDIVTRTLFSTAADHRAEEIAGELDVVLHALNRLVMPWGELWLRTPLPSSKRYKAALRRLNEIVQGFVQERRESGEERGDLLGMLLAARDAETGEAMSDAQIRDEVMTIFVAGHDTTANGLTWTLYLLARHGAIQDRVAGEIGAALGGRPAGFADYSRLTAVEHVFAESMRMYPPVWILGRKALRDYERGDFSAPAGSVLLVCMAVLHRNGAFFEAPDEFRPERWASPSWPRYAYLPFGAGARMCVGERFAWMEGVLCLAGLLGRWRFEAVDDAPAVPLGLLTLRPKHGLRLRITPR